MTLDEITAEVTKAGAEALNDLAFRRKEVAAMATAATEGQLIERPLSASEREIIRASLVFAWCWLTANDADALNERGGNGFKSRNRVEF